MNNDFALRSFEYQLDATTRDSFHALMTHWAQLDNLGKPLKRGQLLFNSFRRRPRVQFKVQRASTVPGQVLETGGQSGAVHFHEMCLTRRVLTRKMKTTVLVVDAGSPEHLCDISPV